MAKSRRVKKRNGHKSNVDEDPGPDISLLSRPSATSVKGLRDVLKAFEDGTPEVNHLLSNECEIIYECRVCRSLYRSFLNFITHKRIYCQQQYTSGSPKASHFFNDVLDEDETLVVHDETGRATRQTNPGTDAVTTMEVDYGPSCSSKPKAVPRKNLTEILGMLSQKASSFEGLKRIVNLDGFAELGNDPASTGFKGRLPRQHLLHLESMESTDVAIRQTVTLGPDGKILPNATNIVSDDDDASSQSPESKTNQDDTESNLLCSKCNNRFSSRKTFKHHMNSVHDPSRVSYVCPCCRSKFANSWSVHRHLKTVHNKTNEQLRKLRDQIQKVVRKKSTDTESSSKKTVTKQLSPKECASNEQQKTYMKRCSEMEVFEKEYKKCSGCSRKFDRFAAFNYHVQNCALRIAALKNIKSPSSVSHRASNSTRNAPPPSALAKQQTSLSTDSVADSLPSKLKVSSRNTTKIESTSGSVSSSSTDHEDQASVVPSTSVLASLKPRERHNSDKRPETYLATKKIEIQLRRDYNKIAVVPTQPEVIDICSSPTIDSNSRSRIDYNKILPSLLSVNSFLNSGIPVTKQDEINVSTELQPEILTTSNGRLSVAVFESQENEKMDDISNDSCAVSRPSSVQSGQSKIDKINLVNPLSSNGNLLTIFSASKENEINVNTGISNDNFSLMPNICDERFSNKTSRSNSTLSLSNEELSRVLKDDEKNDDNSDDCLAVKLNAWSGRLSKLSRRNSLSTSEDFPVVKDDVTNDINSNDSFVLDPKNRSGKLSKRTSRRSSLNIDQDVSADKEEETKSSILAKPIVRSERLFNKTTKKKSISNDVLSASNETKDNMSVKSGIRSVRSRIDVKNSVGNSRPTPRKLVLQNDRQMVPMIRKVRSTRKIGPVKTNLADRSVVASTSFVNEVDAGPGRPILKMRSKLDKMRRGNRLLHNVSVRTSKRIVGLPSPLKVDEKSKNMLNDSSIGTNLRVVRMKLVKTFPPLKSKLDEYKCELSLLEEKTREDKANNLPNKLSTTGIISPLYDESMDSIIKLDPDVNEVISDVDDYNSSNTVDSDSVNDLSVKSVIITNDAEIKEETNVAPTSILESILMHEKNENSDSSNSDQKQTIEPITEKRKKLTPPVVKRASIMEWNGFEEQHISAIYGLEHQKKKFKRYDGREIPQSSSASITPMDGYEPHDVTVEEEYHISDLKNSSGPTVMIKDQEEEAADPVPIEEPILTNTEDLDKFLPQSDEVLDQDNMYSNSDKQTETTTLIDVYKTPSESSEQGEAEDAIVKEHIARTKAEIDEEILKVIFEEEDLSQSYSLNSKKGTIIMDNGTFSLRPCTSDGDKTKRNSSSSKKEQSKHLTTQECADSISYTESQDVIETEQSVSPLEVNLISTVSEVKEITSVEEAGNEVHSLILADEVVIETEEIHSDISPAMKKFRRLSSLVETERVLSVAENEIRPSSAMATLQSSAASSDSIQRSNSVTEVNVTPSSSLENLFTRSRPFRNRVKVKNDDFIYDTDKCINSARDEDDPTLNKHKSASRTSQKQHTDQMTLEPRIEILNSSSLNLNPQVMLYRADDSNSLGLTYPKQSNLNSSSGSSVEEQQSNINSSGYNSTKRKSVRVNTKQ